MINNLYPQSKVQYAKTTIAFFFQNTESLCEEWKRYKFVLRKFPNYGFDDTTQIDIFRNGLQQQNKLLLDAITRCSLMFNSVADLIKFIKFMALIEEAFKRRLDLPR